MDTVIFIQARTGSTRLPKKVLLPLKEKEVLTHVIERTQKSVLSDEVLVLTTMDKEDLAIISLAAKNGVRVFAGSENDVLDRFYQAAKILMPKNIVRITADCPLMDANVIDSVIKLHKETKADYSSNVMEESYPDGLDVEVFTFEALKEAWQRAEKKSEREHVTPYIRENSSFQKVSLKHKEDLSAKRWTLDNAEDYDFIKCIYDALYKEGEYFNMTEILKYLNENPLLEKINMHIERNEGYKKSLKENEE